MTSPQHNPNDVFWLARYAHNTLNPVIANLPGQDDKRFAYLYLGITEHKFHGGLNIYVHGNELDGMIDSQIFRVTKETIDDMAARLPRKWQAALEAAGVTA